MSGRAGKIAGALFACFMAVAQAQEADSRWHLRVLDADDRVKAEATVRFTDEAAQSCMGGSWKRVVVEEKAVKAEEFFPLDTPIAYRVEGGTLTLGRTHVCDGYLFLSGKPDGKVVEGAYDSVGWGRKRLGSFSLQRLR